MEDDIPANEREDPLEVEVPDNEREDPLEVEVPANERKDPLEVEFKLITREEWGAVPPKNPGVPTNHPVEFVALAYNTHVKPCLNEDECKNSMREIQKNHIDQGLDDIHYNFTIAPDGNIYEGRGWNVEPGDFSKEPHLEGKSLCFGVLGDADDPDIDRLTEFITAIYLANYGEEKGYVQENYIVCDDTQRFD